MDINFKLQTKLKQFAMIDNDVTNAKQNDKKSKLQISTKVAVPKALTSLKVKSSSKRTIKNVDTLDIPHSNPNNVRYNQIQNFDDDSENFDDSRSDAIISYQNLSKNTVNNQKNSQVYAAKNNSGKSDKSIIANLDNKGVKLNNYNNYKLNEESSYTQIYNFTNLNKHYPSRMMTKSNSNIKVGAVTSNESKSNLTGTNTPNTVDNDPSFKEQNSLSTISPNKYIDLKKQYQAKIVKIEENKINKSSNSSCYFALYEDSKRLKTKKESMEKTSQMRISKNSQPKITSMAKSIKRDVNNFHERLYPYHKLSTSKDKTKIKAYDSEFDFENENQNLFKILDENDVFDIYGKRINNENIYRRYPKKQVSQGAFYSNFSPVINKNSIKIANKLEPTFIRLTAKRSKSRTMLNSLNQSHNSLSKSKDRSTNNSYEAIPGKYLYEKGLEKMRIKDENFKRRTEQTNNSYLQYTYRPDIKASMLDKSEVIEDSAHIQSQYEKSVCWKNKVNNQVWKSKENLSREQMLNCTFSPQIEKKFVSTDEKIIKRNLSQIYDYVKKRRDHLSKEKTSEVETKKIFVVSKNHEIKQSTPAPVEVYFEIDKRINRKSKSRSQSRENVQKYRNLAGSQQFFDANFSGNNKNYTGKEVSLP